MADQAPGSCMTDEIPVWTQIAAFLLVGAVAVAVAVYSLAPWLEGR